MEKYTDFADQITGLNPFLQPKYEKITFFQYFRIILYFPLFLLYKLNLCGISWFFNIKIDKQLKNFTGKKIIKINRVTEFDKKIILSINKNLLVDYCENTNSNNSAILRVSKMNTDFIGILKFSPNAIFMHGNYLNFLFHFLCKKQTVFVNFFESENLCSTDIIMHSGLPNLNMGKVEKHKFYAALKREDYAKNSPMETAIQQYLNHMNTDTIDLTNLLQYDENLCIDLINNNANYPEYRYKNAFTVESIRSISSVHLNKLVAVEALCTRIDRPSIILKNAQFKCKTCGAQQNRLVEQKNGELRLPSICSNSQLCTNRTKFELNVEKSTFENAQFIVAQETFKNRNRAIPFSLPALLNENMIDGIKPGDEAVLIGRLEIRESTEKQLLPKQKVRKFVEKSVEKNEVKKQKDFSTNKTHSFLFKIFSVENKKQPEMTKFQFEKIEKLFSANLYEKLCDEMFPSIFGHRNIKKALLIQQIGGDGREKRANINILLVGDPGTAKSQFLKQATYFLSGSVIASGKSSSSAGLTAAVVKNRENRFSIEAGALMVADGAICAIDEFDKMDYSDKVALHEAMEQQTISISKAGINCTLNARTSILAAANPVKGRYEKDKSLKQNINFGSALMSRFDLYFVLLDEQNEEIDEAVGRQVIRNYCGETFKNPNIENIKLYINYARKIKTKLSPEVKEILIDKYIALRKEMAVKKGTYLISVRHLESLIRISEAIAKLHLDETVKPVYVDESIRLLRSSLFDVKIEFNVELPHKKLCSENFMRITNIFISLLKNSESTEEELILGYLEKIENQLDIYSLEEEKETAKELIEYLCVKEQILVRKENQMIGIHPNYAE